MQLCLCESPLTTGRPLQRHAKAADEQDRSPTLSAFCNLEKATPATCMQLRLLLGAGYAKQGVPGSHAKAADSFQFSGPCCWHSLQQAGKVQCGGTALHWQQAVLEWHKLASGVRLHVQDSRTLPASRCAKAGPPLLPGLMAASIWMPSSLLLACA